MKDTIRYSESFKQKVVSELSKGKFPSPHEASKAYGIAGSSTVRAWVKKYGRTDLLPRVIRVESENDRNEVEDLKRKIKELEKTVTELAVSEVMHKAYFDIVCDQNGLNSSSKCNTY
ncbi:transposase [Lentisphaera profundi]|uniref:Transposase n=1 Tax=Lentisphaera profundi TaxID=1658616 RepID=A0ABY7VUW0_9BACT|nr:transposase [Lentisphaera profundi]WDE95893.1 transposase [Lentisphaera profundi]